MVTVENLRCCCPCYSINKCIRFRTFWKQPFYLYASLKISNTIQLTILILHIHMVKPMPPVCPYNFTHVINHWSAENFLTVGHFFSTTTHPSHYPLFNTFLPSILSCYSKLVSCITLIIFFHAENYVSAMWGLTCNLSLLLHYRVLSDFILTFSFTHLGQ